MEILIKILNQALIHRRKRITQSRLVAFIKRIAILTLQLQHNSALGILGIIKQSMQLGKMLDILLDTDHSTGDGFYQAELEEPEYCNAHCSALWELTALQVHIYISYMILVNLNIIITKYTFIFIISDIIIVLYKKWQKT